MYKGVNRPNLKFGYTLCLSTCVRELVNGIAIDIVFIGVCMLYIYNPISFECFMPSWIHYTSACEDK